MAIPFPNQIVTLRKGSRVFSCHPKKSSYELSRKQRVKVHAYYPALPPEGHGYPEKKAQVHWAGTGGYWCWTDADNVIPEGE